MRSVAAALLVGMLACGHAPPARPSWPDAPLQLRDDSDRDQAIDQLWVLPAGAARDALRGELAAAIALRIRDALEEDRPFVAENLVLQLASLWQADPTTIGAGLAGQVDLLRGVRATFAKAGAIEPTIAVLAMLAEAEPGERVHYLAELDEILQFADELAAAENGPEAQRAQPIALLQPAVLALPLPWLVDRYVGLLEERQRIISGLILNHGASIQMVRAHHDILQTSRRVAIALARGGRTEDLHAHLERIVGLGADKELAIRAEIVAEQPTPDAFVQLAKVLRSSDKVPDPAAALAVSLAGLRRFPHAPDLLTAAAIDATTLGRVDQPIALYEAAAAAQGNELDPLLAFHLGKLYSERIARLAFGGRPAAADSAWREVGRKTQEAARRAAPAVWGQVLASVQAAFGQGMLSQGRLAEAERALVGSVERAPSVDAFETLATIAEKTNRFASATRYASAGLALLGDTIGDRYRRAKLLRIAADIARLEGRSGNAQELYVDSVNSWASLGKDEELRPAIRAERMLDESRSAWFRGQFDQSVELAFKALDADPEATSRVAEATAFLLEVGRYSEAQDAVHLGLSSSSVTEFYKVYMCLWLLADARHHGVPRDRQAYDYLASRHGDLWYELLAQAATGRVELGALRAAATTGPRQAELAFYAVALGLDPAATTAAGKRRLLEQVVAARLVTEAEYDLARQYLANP